MRSASNSIEQLLKQHGPGLTSDLAAHLQKSGLSPEAARKRLSRLPEWSSVKVLYGLPFPKRTRFVYLHDQFGTQKYWDALIAAVDKNSPAYSSAIAGIHARGGVVPRSHFPIVSGAPLKQKGQLASDTILERLTSIGLVLLETDDQVGEVIRLAGPHYLQDTTPLRVRLLVEDMLLNAIKSWAVKMNFASTNTAKIRGNADAPQYATFCFDICGPCYLRPLRRTRDGETAPGFFVGDVILGKVLTEIHVAPFLRKCSTLSALRKLRPFMPVLVADGFTPEALRACRSAGIMATTPSTLFGQDAGRAMKELFEALSNAALVASGHPDKIEFLFAQLSKVDGIDSNLRGALFEMIVGHMVRAIEGPSIDMGVPVVEHKEGRRAEIDVRLVKEREVTFYECKGAMPTTKVSEEDAEDWLKRCIPTIYAAHRQEDRFKDCTLKFELWTCGGFHPKALSLLEAAKARTSKYDISWKDGEAVRAYAHQIKAPGIRKILNEHYFSHPLADLDKAAKRMKKKEQVTSVPQADLQKVG